MLCWSKLVEQLVAQGEMRIVLASGSPRRKEILISILLSPTSFTCETSSFEETLDKSQFKFAGDYALATARGKALDVVQKTAPLPHGGGQVYVIGADTVIDFGGKIMEKPRDAKHAAAMLEELSGKTHKVHTGVVLYSNAREAFSFVETTEVTFTTLTPQVIDSYVATKEPFDKAGGYGIQGFGGPALVEKIHGDYFNVVGFPGFRFSQLFAEVLEKEIITQ